MPRAWRAGRRGPVSAAIRCRGIAQNRAMVWVALVTLFRDFGIPRCQDIGNAEFWDFEVSRFRDFGNLRSPRASIFRYCEISAIRYSDGGRSDFDENAMRFRWDPRNLQCGPDEPPMAFRDFGISGFRELVTLIPRQFETDGYRYSAISIYLVFGISRFRDSDASRFRRFDIPSFRVPYIEIYWVFEIASMRVVDVPGFRDFGVSGFLDPH